MAEPLKQLKFTLKMNMFVPYVVVGFAKVAGNYAASLLAQTNANNLGYDQVLWLDGVEQNMLKKLVV